MFSVPISRFDLSLHFQRINQEKNAVLLEIQQLLQLLTPVTNATELAWLLMPALVCMGFAWRHVT